jgi:hypothetical protein
MGEVKRRMVLASDDGIEIEITWLRSSGRHRRGISPPPAMFRAFPPPATASAARRASATSASSRACAVRRDRSARSNARRAALMAEVDAGLVGGLFRSRWTSVLHRQSTRTRSGAADPMEEHPKCGVALSVAENTEADERSPNCTILLRRIGGGAGSRMLIHSRL